MSEGFVSPIGSSVSSLSSEDVALSFLDTMLDNASRKDEDDPEENVPPEFDDLDRIVFMPTDKMPGSPTSRMNPLLIASIAACLIVLVMGGLALSSGTRKTSHPEVPSTSSTTSPLNFDEALGHAQDYLAQIGGQFRTTSATLLSEQQKRIAEMEAERAAEEAAAAEEETSDDTTDYYVDDTTYETDYSETTYYYTYDDDNSTDADSEDASTVENVTPVEDTSQTADSDQAQEVTYDDATESTEVSDTAGLEQDDQALATNI